MKKYSNKERQQQKEESNQPSLQHYIAPEGSSYEYVNRFSSIIHSVDKTKYNNNNNNKIEII